MRTSSQFSRPLLATALTITVAGCGVEPTATPNAPQAAQIGVNVRDDIPLRDVVARVIPALAPSPAVSALRAALVAALQHQNDASLYAVESALERLLDENPNAAVEVDVIRLALAVQP